jgi:aspartate aminotransferase-like enzyme
MIPGPTPVPSEVLRALSKPMINHRAKNFADILDRCTQGVKWMYQTENDVYILTCSGTGGLEAALVNVLSPGDKVLALISGVFGKRFADIAQTYGAEVDRYETPLGQAYDVPRVEEALERQPYKLVLMTHNETSTAVLNPIAAVAAAVRKHLPDAVILVDAVSGLGTADLPVDKLDLDVVVAGSQKAFMVPPGLAMVSMSPRAWEVHKSARTPRFYFDLGKARDFLAKGQTPWTPAVSVFYGLDAAVASLRAEGLHNIFARHEMLSRAVRAGVKALGMKLLVVDDAAASRAVTAIYPPEGVSPGDFRKLMQQRFNIVLAGGQGPLTDSIFRVGHLGYCGPLDILDVLGALEIALRDLGADIAFGKGVAAAQEIFAAKEAPAPAMAGR